MTDIPVVRVPVWLVEQFEIEAAEEMPSERKRWGPGAHKFRPDESVLFNVGQWRTKSDGAVSVEYEAASGRSNWWTTINVLDPKGNLLEQSEPGETLLGLQEFVLEDGTSILFEVVPDESLG